MDGALGPHRCLPAMPHPDDLDPEEDRDPWSCPWHLVSPTALRTREGPAVTDGRAFTCAC